MTPESRQKLYLAGALGVAMILLAVLTHQIWTGNVTRLLELLLYYVQTSELSPALFFLLLLVLPLGGFPISIFCLMAGARFGTIPGLLVIAVAMAFHLIMSWLIMKTFLRKRLDGWIHYWLKRRNIESPEISEDRAVPYAIAFVAVPLIPYAAKNYLLALSGLPLAYYLLIAWSIQLAYSFPLVSLAGAAADQSYVMVAFAAALLLVLYFVSRWSKSVLFGKDKRS